jgi:hypothetical protein
MEQYETIFILLPRFIYFRDFACAIDHRALPPNAVTSQPVCTKDQKVGQSGQNVGIEHTIYRYQVSGLVPIQWAGGGNRGENGVVVVVPKPL